MVVVAGPSSFRGSLQVAGSYTSVSSLDSSLVSAGSVVRQKYWHLSSLLAAGSIVGPLVGWVVGVDVSRRSCRTSRISLAVNII